jgi:hypothetical protein
VLSTPAAPTLPFPPRGFIRPTAQLHDGSCTGSVSDSLAPLDISWTLRSALATTLQTPCQREQGRAVYAPVASKAISTGHPLHPPISSAACQNTPTAAACTQLTPQLISNQGAPAGPCKAYPSPVRPPPPLPAFAAPNCARRLL